MTAVFLRFESLPEAPLHFLRGLNKASRSSRFLDVETEGTSKSARSTALIEIIADHVFRRDYGPVIFSVMGP